MRDYGGEEKKRKPDVKRLIIRFLAGFIAFLMFAGMFVYTILSTLS